MTVGVVVPDLTNPIFPPLVRGVQTGLEISGYHALIVNTDNDLDRERAQVELLLGRQVDGLIFATGRRRHPLVAELAEQEAPVVLANRRVDGCRLPSVLADDAAGIELAVQHLVRLGHRRIAHLAGPMDTSTGVARSAAFRTTVHALGLPELPVVVATGWTEGAGGDAARELLGMNTGVTGVIAGNDLIALGCLAAVASRGLSCPEDISVVGFNGMAFAETTHPTLTTIAVPHHGIGVEAARLLLEHIAQGVRPVHSLVLPVSLVTRGSTGPVGV